MVKIQRTVIISQLLIFIVAMVSCGGGSGGGTVAGIGGTGSRVTGPIDGFGSIFVNGIEFELDTATITVDSANATESQLSLGMVVTVFGTVDDSGLTGVAESVEFDDDVQGPISSISNNADGTVKTLLVFGLPVVADQASTIFDGVTFDTLAINDVVEVSGFMDANFSLQATRIEKKEDFLEGVSEIEIKGSVSGLSGTQFNLGTLTIDFSAADLSDIEGGNLSNGMSVEVKGTLSATVITASIIEQEDGLFGEDEERVSFEGIISEFLSVSNFKLSGQPVNAANAQLQPATLQLKNGIQVQVEGSVVNGVLVADEVESRSSEITLVAPVLSLDVSGSSGTVTLAFAAGNVSFSVNNQTELRDETDSFDPLSLSNIRAGDYLEVKALTDNGQLMALEVRLQEASAEMLEGQVDSFISSSEITVLGLSYSTSGASFEDSNDMPITGSDFYMSLQNGNLVKIKDDEPADGIADDVEYED